MRWLFFLLCFYLINFVNICWRSKFGFNWSDTFSYLIVLLSWIIFFISKYSIHIFSFFESSVSETKTFSSLFFQFIRDITNSFAFFLRIGLLLLRLNVYDCLDDFLDSYYIFIDDFEEDNISEEFSVGTSIFFFNDNLYDTNLTNKAESDFALNFFSFFFILWGKLFFFFYIYIGNKFSFNSCFLYNLFGFFWNSCIDYCIYWVKKIIYFFNLLTKYIKLFWFL